MFSQRLFYLLFALWAIIAQVAGAPTPGGGKKGSVKAPAPAAGGAAAATPTPKPYVPIAALPRPALSLQTYANKGFNYRGEVTVPATWNNADAEHEKEHQTDINRHVEAAAKEGYEVMVGMHAAGANKNKAQPLTFSALYHPGNGKVYFASNIKGTEPSTPSTAVDEIYDTAFPHRSFGNCAEMAAIAMATTINILIANGRIATYGLRASGEGPMKLNPCRDFTTRDGQHIYGCTAYTNWYGLTALY